MEYVYQESIKGRTNFLLLFNLRIKILRNLSTHCLLISSYVSYRSFAYITIKDRLPVILTKIIDTLSRNKENIAEIYGEVKHTFEDSFDRV